MTVVIDENASGHLSQISEIPSVSLGNVASGMLVVFNFPEMNMALHFSKADVAISACIKVEQQRAKHSTHESDGKLNSQLDFELDMQALGLHMHEVLWCPAAGHLSRCRLRTALKRKLPPSVI